MDKQSWLNYAHPVCQPFVTTSDTKQPKFTKRLQATFRNRLNNDSIGRSAFQNVYDLISSWPCWDVVEQDQDWKTTILWEVSPTQIASSSSSSSSNNGLCHTSQLKHYIESDEQCINVKYFTVQPLQNKPLPLHLPHTPDVNQFSGVTIQSYVHDNTSQIKLVSNATYSNVEVVKQKLFTLKTHFHWQYEFRLAWSCPYVEDRESTTVPLVFKQEPKCQFRITCSLLDNTPDVSTQYVSESLLLKVHESIPALYKAPDGTSVCLPLTSSTSSTLSTSSSTPSSLQNVTNYSTSVGSSTGTPTGSTS